MPPHAAVVIAKPGTKADQKASAVLEEVLGGIAPERDRVFGLWTNGFDLAFRMREYSKRTVARLATGWAGSPFAGRGSHPLDDKPNFMKSSHPHSLRTGLAWSHRIP